MPGSGKSTRAKKETELGAIHIEPDMFCIIDGFYIYTKEGYKEACSTAASLVRQLSWRFHCDIVYSDVLCTIEDVKDIIKLVPDFYKIEVIDLIISEEEARKRNIHNVSREDLAEMAKRWEPYS